MNKSFVFKKLKEYIEEISTDNNIKPNLKIFITGKTQKQMNGIHL